VLTTREAETIQFGPLLQEVADLERGALELVWLGIVMDAIMQTADSLSLTYNDQNHSVCHTNDKKVSDIFLQKLYQNAVTGILQTVNFWVEAKKYYDDCGGVIEDGDPFLDHQLPKIWYTSAGGGRVTAGEKGCPSFALSWTRKDAPDAYIGSSKKDTPDRE
jgi:hypothetical protein